VTTLYASADAAVLVIQQSHSEPKTKYPHSPVGSVFDCFIYLVNYGR